MRYPDTFLKISFIILLPLSVAIHAGILHAQSPCLAPVKTSPNAKKATITSESRQACLKIAALSFPQPDLDLEDFYMGDQQHRGFLPEEQIYCRFTPHPRSGASPKFRCHLTDSRYRYLDRNNRVADEAAGTDTSDYLTDIRGERLSDKLGKSIKADKVRIKYTMGSSRHREVFTEVAASRIFWALGFYSDAMYSVKVSCLGCKEDPFGSWQGSTAHELNEFYPASVERKLPGKEIETRDDEGWSTKELEDLYRYGSPAKQAEIEALMLAGNLFYYHNVIAKQNRMTCLDGHWNKQTGECYTPVLYIQDLGGTFGSKGIFINPRGDYSKWKDRTIFKDRTSCRVRARFGGLKFVSERGRLFLWNRLQNLTREKVRSIFTVARFDFVDPDLREQVWKANPLVTAEELNRKVIDIWVDTFMDRIREIRSARCPETVDNDH